MKQNNFHPKRITGKQKYAFALAIVLLLFGSLACVPNVRAFAEDIIQQMGIAFMDTGQRDRVVQMAEAAPTMSNDLPSSLSEAEIQGQISFQLLLPAWVPNGGRSSSITIRKPGWAVVLRWKSLTAIQGILNLPTGYCGSRPMMDRLGLLRSWLKADSSR
jgi:hypothetical protein